MRERTRARGHCGCFGYAYLIRRADGLYKIGSTVQLRDRLSRISAGLVGVVTVVTVAPAYDAPALERQLQVTLRAQCVRGDWFHLESEHVEMIVDAFDAEPRPDHTDYCSLGEPVTVNGEVVDQSFSGDGEWLAPNLAAVRLGMSERTLWRRIDTGKLRKRLRDGRAQVYVPVAGRAPDTEDAPVAGRVPATDGSALATVTPDNQAFSLAVIEELRRQHQETLDIIERQSGQIADLSRQLGSSETERDVLCAELLLARRPWWRRWIDSQG